MRMPRSIQFHLAAVFLLFFALVVVLGSFSIWRLSSFEKVSADIAQIWLPTTQALGDLNNYTSDFRAIEGSYLLSADRADAAATAAQMTVLDRTVAEAERSFERIPHSAAEDELYRQFKAQWNVYRGVVNEALALASTDRKAEAQQIYIGRSRAAYDAASDTLGALTDKATANAQAARDRLASAYREAFWLIILSIAVAALLVVAALIHVSRSISAPLRLLAGRMRRLAANDTAGAIEETSRRDEIGEMAQATVVFRNNAIALMESQSMLARQAALLEEQLAHEQRIALMQRNFVSMASHEFRTPLTVIDGHARRLDKLKAAVKPGEIGERAGKIRSAVLRLTHLIDNLLNSSRLIDGGAGLYFNPAKIDVAAVLHEVCQLHREMVPAAQIVEHSAPGPIDMHGDGKLLALVFSNLLGNAVKYSPAGGPIEVALSATESEIAVSVADNGIGIPRADREQVFERYHRGSNVSGIVGTGVGLYIVKMVIDMHGGSVEVESSEGEGSRFAVHLPRGLDAATEIRSYAGPVALVDA